jgi:hypothetical protein
MHASRLCAGSASGCGGFARRCCCRARRSAFGAVRRSARRPTCEETDVRRLDLTRRTPPISSGTVVSCPPLCEDGLKIYTSYFFGGWCLTREPDPLKAPAWKMPVHRNRSGTRHVFGGRDLTDLTKLMREGLSRGMAPRPPYHALVVRHFCETLQSFFRKKKIPNQKKRGCSALLRKKVKKAQNSVRFIRKHVTCTHTRRGLALIQRARL